MALPLPNSERELRARTRFEFPRAKRERTPAGGYGGVRALRVQLEARTDLGVNSVRSKFAALRVRAQIEQVSAGHEDTSPPGSA